MFVRLSGPSLSRAVNLHLSSSNLQAISQQSVSSQSAVIYESVILFVIIPSEPKILRLVLLYSGVLFFKGSVSGISFSPSLMNPSEKIDTDNILSVFEPISSDLVAAPCSWVLHSNKDTNRIPGQIQFVFFKFIMIIFTLFTEVVTEVLCTGPGHECGGLSSFSCKQMKTLMKVAIKTRVTNPDTKGQETRLVEENVPFRLGCSCTMKMPTLFNNFIPGLEEK